MPEYLAPGVFIEETSFRAKSIEGVSTTTTGFVGPTRSGPLDIEPEIITSLVEFERTYGGKERLEFEDEGTIDNYMWHAARAFFEEGGKRLYVTRVFATDAASPPDPLSGFANLSIGSPAFVSMRARFPGRSGDARVTFTFQLGQDILSKENEQPRVRSLQDRDVVMIRDLASPPSASTSRGFFLALQDRTALPPTWLFSSTGEDDASPMTTLAELDPDTTEVRIVTVSVLVDPITPGMPSVIESNLALDPHHQRGDSPDSLFDVFAPHARDPDDPTAKVIANLARARTTPLVIENIGGLTNGIEVLQAFFAADLALSVSPPGGVEHELEAMNDKPGPRSASFVMTGGTDGIRPTAAAYLGDVDPVSDLKTGLRQFEDLEDVSIIAAPGSTFGYESDGYGPQSQGIVRNLINHAQLMKYRIAVIDSGDNQSIGQVRAMRALLDSSHAALYYPWIRVLDPLSQKEIHVPPSGFVSGIYARNDVNRAVYKAPANEVVNLALGFERFLNKAQQEVLNPEGINCFRFFEGRGMRLWGARTISSDPEWKYVNLRRYFAYLERSIDKGTQWAVFEPNGPQLWANVRRTIESFLLNEWQNGALLGDTPDKSYFVKCDRSTMTQNDIDNGRLICLVGVAALRPAEFVIFRIGQWTSDRKI
jgi:phage tail sheath protein FI